MKSIILFLLMLFAINIYSQELSMKTAEDSKAFATKLISDHLTGYKLHKTKEKLGKILYLFLPEDIQETSDYGSMYEIPGAISITFDVAGEKIYLYQLKSSSDSLINVWKGYFNPNTILGDLKTYNNTNQGIEEPVMLQKINEQWIITNTFKY